METKEAFLARKNKEFLDGARHDLRMISDNLYANVREIKDATERRQYMLEIERHITRLGTEFSSLRKKDEKDEMDRIREKHSPYWEDEEITPWSNPEVDESTGFVVQIDRSQTENTGGLVFNVDKEPMDYPGHYGMRVVYTKGPAKTDTSEKMGDAVFAGVELLVKKEELQKFAKGLVTNIIND
jgi:hypothetical protein